MSDINLSLIDGGDINLGITEDGDINLSIEDDSSINLSIEGVTSFVTLTDSPSTYSGQSGKVVSVNSGETGVEFTTATGGEWGTITGTLSNQTDLQSALDLKVEEDTSPNFLEPSLDAIQFDLTATPTCAEGKMHWNIEDGTLEVGMPGGAVKLQVGQETIMRVTNQSGADMTNGDVVYVSGGVGNRPTIELADADSLFTSGVIGVLTEDISNNNSGYVTTFGLVRDIDTSSFSAGQVLWLSTTAGELTSVRPSPPKTSVVVAICVVSHATEGVILVKTQNVPRLVGLSDVDISGQSDNDFIYYDDASTTWKAKQLTGGDITGFTEGSVPFADSDGSLIQDNSDFFWDNTNKRLGIGTTDPSYKIDIHGTSSEDIISSQVGYNIESVEDPTTLSGVATAGTELEIGTYYYTVYYGTDLGRTNRASTTVVTTSGNQNVTLTLPISSDSRVTKRYLKRSKATHWSQFDLITINDNTTTEFIDNIPDVDLTDNQYITNFANTTTKYITINENDAMTLDPVLTAIGVEAGTVKEGSSTYGNTVIGYQAGKILELNGSVGIGHQALGNTSNTNTSVVAIGTRAMYDATGLGGVGIGIEALKNVTGAYNNAIGTYAMQSSTGASYNQAMGNYAGNKITTGDYNVFIGHYAGNDASQLGTAQNSIGIGYNTYTTKDNQVVLGNSSIVETLLNGNVGVGETTPLAKLHIDTGITTKVGQIIKGVASQSANLQEWQDSSGNALLYVENDGELILHQDSKKIYFGAGKDSSIYYDGTNMVFDSQEAGTGYFNFLNGQVAQQTSSNKINFVSQKAGTTVGQWSGYGFVSSTGDGSVRQKAGIAFERLYSAGRGSMHFLINNVDGVDNVVLSDSKMTIDHLGNVGIGTTDPDTILDVNGAITQRELSSDPADPDEGANVVWQSDGTGTGDDGDILMKITAGGSTKTITIVDFSAA